MVLLLVLATLSKRLLLATDYTVSRLTALVRKGWIL